MGEGWPGGRRGLGRRDGRQGGRLTHPLCDGSVAIRPSSLFLLFGRRSHVHRNGRSIGRGGQSRIGRRQAVATATVGTGGRFLGAAEFEHVPVENVVVSETLSVEQVPKEVSQVRVVGFLFETQRSAVVEIGSKLSCNKSKHTRVPVQLFPFFVSKIVSICYNNSK